MDRQFYRDLAASDLCMPIHHALVPKSTVLYGNLPTKNFVSSRLNVAEVERLSRNLPEKMRGTGHPFILGGECDLLSVPGSEREIVPKVDAFMNLS